MSQKFIYFIPHILLTLLLSACNNTPVIEEKPRPALPASKPCRCEGVKGEEIKGDEIKSEEVKKVTPTIIDEKKSTDTQTTLPAKTPDYGLLKPASWESIDGLYDAALSSTWPAWRQGCVALRNKLDWKKVCELSDVMDANAAGKPTDASILAYFKTHFSVYQTTNADGSESGLITGYYEPILKGSRAPSSAYPFPLYAAPNDLVTVALEDLYPELKYKRIRGRLVGNKLIPYYNRADIETETSPIARHAFVYVNDKIDLFFLQIQGSGLITFENGEQMHVGYADQNGHSYQSIGKLLIANGELVASEASMQGIKKWALKNPEKLQLLLNQNPSYVFFRELPAGLPGPLGALGVPLLSEQTLAIDPKFIPLGAPVFLSTTMPNSAQTLKKLMMAQDTGGAIKGGVRADFYWGSGHAAGEKAGAMKQTGKMWVLLPIEFKLQN